MWNELSTYEGLGRTMTNFNDTFVLSRILKHPELIFKDLPSKTSCNNSDYFEKDFASHWRLSEQNQCFLCDRYKYVAVFYERGVFAGNKGLVEVRDESIVKHLKNEFLKDSGSKTSTPIIFGTLSNCGTTEWAFQRKQKMLRTSIFALLSVMNCNEFLDKSVKADVLQEALINYLQYDLDEVMNQPNIKNAMNGWRFVM